MKLYYSATSPYVRKVMVLLHESGQTEAVALEPTHGTPFETSATAIAQNPLGKVPALARDDGPALYDSRVICRYLDTRFQAGFYPDGARLWDTLTLEATADGILDAALLMVYEGRLRPADKQFPDWIEAQWHKVSNAIDAVNSRWMSQLSGPLDMGQIAVGCALGYLDLRHDARGWRAGHEALADWYERFADRDSMLATVPPAG